MRILYICDRLSGRGGADQHLLDVAQAAVAAGHRVAFALGSVAEGLSLPGPVHRVRALGSAVADARQLDRLGAPAAAADLLHIQNVVNPLALDRLRELGPCLVTIQDHRAFCPGPGRSLPDGSPCRQPMAAATCAACLPDAAYRQRLLELTEARRAALKGLPLIVLSAYMAEELAAAGLPGARVLPPWLTCPLPEPVAGAGYLLAGRLVAHKGLSLVAEAWAQLSPPLALRLAGLGAEAARLPQAEALGWLDRPALWAAQRASRALLFPSRWQEPFGIVAVEALAQGTPVLRTATGGSGDWAEAGVWTLPPDAAAWAEALRALEADPSRALALGRAGQAAVAARFDGARLRPSLWALYEEVSAGRLGVG